MATLKLQANIREINKYEFTVEVDNNLTYEEQRAQACDKLKAYLEENIPHPFASDNELITDVRCVDVERGMSTEDVTLIEIKD